MSDSSAAAWGPRQQAAEDARTAQWLAETRRHRVLVRGLLAAVVAVAVARLVMTYDRSAFVHAWGVAHHLDMSSFLGQEVAKRSTPGSWDSALFSLLCVLLLLVPMVPRVARGAPWARYAALVLAGLGGLNSLGSLAQPAPWWYHLATVIMVALTGVVIVLIWRMPVIDDAQLRHDLAMERRQRPAS